MLDKELVCPPLSEVGLALIENDDCGAGVIVKSKGREGLLAKYSTEAPLDAVTEHVPNATGETTPVLLLIEQIFVVKELKDMVPLPLPPEAVRVMASVPVMLALDDMTVTAIFCETG